MLTTSYARAYVNWGRWIAVCPNPDCNSAEELHPWSEYTCTHRECRVTEFPDSIFHCSNCHLITPIEWPMNAYEIWRELQNRPKEENRNWYPADHDQAVQWNLPHGQSVADLAAELAEREPH